MDPLSRLNNVWSAPIMKHYTTKDERKGVGRLIPKFQFLRTGAAWRQVAPGGSFSTWSQSTRPIVRKLLVQLCFNEPPAELNLQLTSFCKGTKTGTPKYREPQEYGKNIKGTHAPGS